MTTRGVRIYVEKVGGLAAGTLGLWRVGQVINMFASNVSLKSDGATWRKSQATRAVVSSRLSGGEHRALQHRVHMGRSCKSYISAVGRQRPEAAQPFRSCARQSEGLN